MVAQRKAQTSIQANLISALTHLANVMNRGELSQQHAQVLAGPRTVSKDGRPIQIQDPMSSCRQNRGQKGATDTPFYGAIPIGLPAKR